MFPFCVPLENLFPFWTDKKFFSLLSLLRHRQAGSAGKTAGRQAGQWVGTFFRIKKKQKMEQDKKHHQGGWRSRASCQKKMKENFIYQKENDGASTFSKFFSWHFCPILPYDFLFALILTQKFSCPSPLLLTPSARTSRKQNKEIDAKFPFTHTYY